MSRTLAEQARSLKLGRGDRGLPALVLLTDPVRLPDPRALLPHLPAGSAVILRHGDPLARAALAMQLAPLCRRLRLRLLIAGDAALAVRVGAAGVHWPERQIPRGRWRRPRSLFLVMAAAHGRAALQRAARAGADAALLSPVLPTRSHPGGAVLGVWRFAALVAGAVLPVYALGGIDRRTARRLSGSGAAGIAAIGGLIE